MLTPYADPGTSFASSSSSSAHGSLTPLSGARHAVRHRTHDDALPRWVLHPPQAYVAISRARSDHQATVDDGPCCTVMLNALLAMLNARKSLRDHMDGRGAGHTRQPEGVSLQFLAGPARAPGPEENSAEQVSGLSA